MHTMRALALCILTPMLFSSIGVFFCNTEVINNTFSGRNLTQFAVTIGVV